MVPNGWELKKLSELCDLNPKKPQKPVNKLVSFIPMNQISEAGKVISVSTREYDDVSKGFTSFIDDDVLIAKITPCFENGKGALVTNLTNGVGFGSTEFHVLRAKKDTCPEFIFYLTRQRELRVKGEMNMQGSAGHRRVTVDYFKAYKVKTPPLPEQRKIAKILSTWDKAITTTEKLIASSQQQKKALMQQLLTGKKRLVRSPEKKGETGMVFEGDWEEVKLNTIAKVSIGLVTTMTKHYVPDGVPLIRNSDIKQNKIRTEKLIYLSDSFASESEHRKFQLNDVVTVHTGEVGVSAVIADDMVGSIGFATLNTRPNLRHVFPQFLSWYFNSDYFINWCIAMSTGDGRQNLNLKDFVKAVIPLPNIKEQQKIASVLTAADKEISLLQAKLAHLKQEKKALMQQLLTGKKRVKVEAA